MNQKGTWQLILMAREGDRSAVDSLFFMTFPSAYLILLNIMGNKDTALSILTGVYAEVFSRLDEIENVEEFTKNVHKLSIERASKDVNGKNLLKHDESLCAKASEFVEDTTCFYDFNTIKGVETASTADCIFSVLNTLSLEKRVYLYLYYFVSTSPQDIASIVSASEEQVTGALASAFSDAVPLLKKVCEKSAVLKGINEKSVILWAVRNTTEFALSPEEIDKFYPQIAKKFVEGGFFEAGTANSDGVNSNIDIRSMKRSSRKKEILGSIFNLRNLIIFLVLAVAVCLAVTINKLSEYSERRQEREALTSRTTLRYLTTVPSSERVIFSTEYTDIEAEETSAEESSVAESEAEIVTNEENESETAKREQSDFSYVESGNSVTVTGYDGEGINITVPEKLNGKTVTAIGDNAFYGSKIVNINLPSTVVNIGKNAFHSCTGLQAIKLPIGVKTIGTDAFRGCTNLSSVSLPSTLTKIGAQAFYKCSSLKAIALPASLTTIGDWAFAYCSSLGNITIPKSVTSVGASVFYECKAMKKCTFESPSKVSNLGESLFFDCSSLESVVLPANVRTIPSNCFYGCKSLATVSLSAVTHINESAFEGCSSLASVGFSTSLLKIERAAFLGCSSLMKIKLPSNTLSLGEKAFANCSSLSEIYIPSSVTRIGENAFKGCEMLVIDCPDGSAAEEYAKENGIELYGKDNSENDM